MTIPNRRRLLEALYSRPSLLARERFFRTPLIMLRSNKINKSKAELFSILTSLKSDIITAEHTEPGYDEATGNHDGLTQREQEVLRLVAQGKNNSEIAEELFISLNTVTRHMTNIFSKTDTNNRVEAAVYTIQHRLL